MDNPNPIFRNGAFITKYASVLIKGDIKYESRTGNPACTSEQKVSTFKFLQGRATRGATMLSYDTHS